MEKIKKSLKNKFWGKNWPNLIALLLLIFMFSIALCSSKGVFGQPGDSAIMDEVAHVPAGYTSVNDQDYRLNPEHPPLAKALAGLPLALKGDVKGPESDWSWTAIDQWEAGWFMLYEAGNNPADLLLWSRIPIMLLMILLGFLLFKWAKELYGSKVALVVLGLYAFYPDILAHGRLVTTDVAAALGFTAAVYTFERALSNKGWKFFLWAILGLAFAQLLKFSAIMLFLIFFILCIVKAILERKETGGFFKAFWPLLKKYFWVCFWSVVLVIIVYIPFVWNTPAGIEHQLIEKSLTSDNRTLFLRDFLHHFENNPFSRAIGHYLLGIFMVIGRVAGGNVTFIIGQLTDKSFHWYFPVAWFLKTSIPVILLTLYSVFVVIKNWPKQKEVKWILAVILTPMFVYWGSSVVGQLNLGIRHLLPTVPFLLLLIGYAIHPLLNNMKKKAWPGYLAIGLVVLAAISTISNYPNFISYFNEATPRDAKYTKLIDSSLDWGQDLLRLEKYVSDNKIENIKIDYFGGGLPSYSIPKSQEWRAGCGPTKGWLAVSATYYQSSKWTSRKESKWSYDWLDSFTPKTVIGGSILVYNISDQDYITNPPKSPHQIKKYDYCPQTNTKDNRKVGL
jgi:hypothetical protein